MPQAENKTVLQCVVGVLFPIMDHLTFWRNAKFSSLLAATNKSPINLLASEIQDTVNQDTEYLNIEMFLIVLLTKLLTNL